MTLMQRRRALMAVKKGVTENFVRVGNPTIVNGIMTPSADSWIKLPNAFSPTVDDTWELVFKVIKTGTDGFQNLLTSFGILLQVVQGGALTRIYLRSSGSTTWDITSGTTATININQWTWIKVSYNGSQYEVLTSIDGVTYTRWQHFTSSNALATSTFLLGAKASNTSLVQGQYDLNEAYIKLNSNYWWRAYT